MDIATLIKEYGIYVGLMVAGITNYILLRDRKTKAEAEASKAAINQQNVITDKFTELFAENRMLQAKLDELEAAFNDAKFAAVQTTHELAQVRAVADKQSGELVQAHERAARLENEVKELTGKVKALETEKVSWEGKMNTERAQLNTTTQALAAANTRITELQGRVSTLEGENKAFIQLLDKLQVVNVDKDSPKE